MGYDAAILPSMRAFGLEHSYMATGDEYNFMCEQLWANREGLVKDDFTFSENHSDFLAQDYSFQWPGVKEMRAKVPELDETQPEGDKMRSFESGATRSSKDHKIVYTGFLDPEVVHMFGEYMLRHRKQADGQLRAPDNWKKGIPQGELIDSLVRHVVDLWRLHEGANVIDPDTNEPANKKDLCSAIMFNVMAYAREVNRHDSV